MDSNSTDESITIAPILYSWYRGNVLHKYVEELVRNKTGDPDSTLKQMSEINNIKIYMYVTDLANQASRAFSSENPSTEDLPLALVTRTSSSLPKFFDTQFFKKIASNNTDGFVWEYTKDTVNATVFVDRGLMMNYPILPIQNLYSGYISALVETALTIEYTGYTNLPDVLKDTVTIDRKGILFTDFSLTKKQKKSLLESGCKSVLKHNDRMDLVKKCVFDLDSVTEFRKLVRGLLSNAITAAADENKADQQFKTSIASKKYINISSYYLVFFLCQSRLNLLINILGINSI